MIFVGSLIALLLIRVHSRKSTNKPIIQITTKNSPILFQVELKSFWARDRHLKQNKNQKCHPIPNNQQCSN